jgi:hypothetical protein
MSITAKVAQQNSLKAKVSQQQEVVAQTVKLGVVKLQDLSDVDTSLLDEGSLLIYNSSSSKFEAKSEVSNSNTRIIGGSF